MIPAVGALAALSAVLAAAPLAAAEPACPEDDAAVLEAARAAPVGRHFTGDYLVDSAYFRVELHGQRVTLVRKSDSDAAESHASYETSAADAALRDGAFHALGLRRARLPLSDDDRRNCLLWRLHARGLLDEEPAAGGSLYEAIHAQTGRRDALPADGRKPDAVAAQAGAAFARAPQTVGTEGLGPCVGVAVYSASTHKAAVAHFDPNLPVAPLASQLLAPFDGEDAGALQASVVGGWTGMSERALYFIRAALAARGVRVVNEDVLGDDGTTGGPKGRAFKVDAATGGVTRAP